MNSSNDSKVANNSSDGKLANSFDSNTDSSTDSKLMNSSTDRLLVNNCADKELTNEDNESIGKSIEDANEDTLVDYSTSTVEISEQSVRLTCQLVN